jgi:hypothetical protein
MTTPKLPMRMLLLCLLAVPAPCALASGIVLNIRDFGAAGDGRFHSVVGWRDAPHRRAFEKLAPASPALREWSVDEAAFSLAKRALPPEGGTIYFPSGTYLAAADSWRILRDNVRLLGDGADRTILMTGARVQECLVLSGYRHIGWSRTYPIGDDDGNVGTLELHLQEPVEEGSLASGKLVFIRDGANRFDQDYGEFNEVAHVNGDQVELVHPLARDYRLSSANWAGKVGAPFDVPAPGSSVDVPFSRDAGCFIPPPGESVTIGGHSFRVDSVGHAGRVRLTNADHGKAVLGGHIEAGSVVSKERGLVVLVASTRGFQCERLTIRGRRKALDISNSYESSFIDCTIERKPDGVRVSGGIVIDGDDGRFATFTRCAIQADPPCGMQFARSFGDVTFNQCHFVNADAAFTEFSFNCSVVDSTFDMSGSPRFKDVVIVGWSCGSVRLMRDTIRARGVDAVFDARSDIQSARHRSEGEMLIADCTVVAEDTGAVFLLDARAPVKISGNSVTGNFRKRGDGSE